MTRLSSIQARRIPAMIALLLVCAWLPGIHGRQLAAAPAPGPGGAATVAPPNRPVAFEGSAFLITYYSGVAEGLLERGVIVPGETPLAGLSGGAFTSVATTLGLSGKDQRQFWKDTVTNCTERWGDCTGKLNAMVEESLDGFLPENITDAVNGAVRIGLSQLDSSQLYVNNSATWVVDEWTDKADLVSCLTSTDYIPCWTGSTIYTLFRNNPVVDGGFAVGFADLCPDGIDNCLKVASYYVGDLANHTCDPEKCPISAASGCVTAERTPESKVTELYPLAGEYVDQWPLTDVEQRCPASAYQQRPEAPYPLPAFVPHNSTPIDIHPGRYNRLPEFNGSQVLACQWQDWASSLPKGAELEAMDIIYQQGLQDALAWCDLNGYSAAGPALAV